VSDRTEDLIYLAGYFDGEGCVCVSKPDGNALIAIKVQSGDKDVVDMFAEVFGGYVQFAFPSSRNGLRTKRQQFIWSVAGSKAQAVLWELLPYLRAKWDVVAYALMPTYQSSLDRHITVDPVELTVRHYIAKEIKAINQRITVCQPIN